MNSINKCEDARFMVGYPNDISDMEKVNIDRRLVC